jgi:predicted ester cyclase
MTSTIAADRTTHLLALMKQGDDAFNRADFEAMSAVHDESLVCHMTGSAEALKGDNAHRQAMQGMMRSFPDVHVHNDPYPIQFGQGDWTTVVTRTTGTFTGEMMGPDGKSIPPTGKVFDLLFTTIARWNGDKLAEEWVFWDSALMQQQIGLS